MRRARQGRWPAALVALVTLVVAWQLVEAKRDRVDLQAAVRGSVRDFTQGLPLPPLPVQQGPESTSLDRLCAGDSTRAIFFVQADCAACAEVFPHWERAVAGLPRGRALVVHVGDVPEHGRSFGQDAVARGQDYLNHIRVNKVPAVLQVNDSCNLAAAGAGVVSSLEVISGLAGER